MKRIGLKALLVLAVLAVLVWSPLVQAGRPDQTMKPTVFCTVLKEPDPILLGGWKCIFRLQLDNGEVDTNPAEYWLIKIGDQYALYFDRVARNGRKRYMGWKDWNVNGKEITSGKEIRIHTENGQVYFTWKDEAPVKMTKIDLSPPR
jgi:hypothetical protein